MDKIVLLGGTFNPLSKAHDRILQASKRLVKANKAILLPTADGFLKTWKGFDANEILPLETRLKILREYCRRHKNTLLETIEVDHKTSFTVDSLDYLKRKYNTTELFFVLGTEKAKELDRWHDSQKLLSANQFIMVRRHDDNLDSIAKEPTIRNYKKHFLFLDVGESTQEISSTLIREAIVKEDISSMKKLTYNYVIDILKEDKII